jgi:hypothetical protein
MRKQRDCSPGREVRRGLGNPQNGGRNMMLPEQPERPRKQGNVVRIETEFATRVRLMLHWQAQRAARAIVIRELKAAGIRTSLMSSIKLTRLTLDYLCQTSRRVARASRGIRRCAKLSSDAQPKAR